jgi:hypothetical protein
MKRCVNCNFRTINFSGYSYCKKIQVELTTTCIWIERDCEYFQFGNDGINPYV